MISSLWPITLSAAFLPVIEKENVMRFTPAAEKLMKQLDWPGNVRELQNLVECIVQLCLVM